MPPGHRSYELAACAGFSGWTGDGNAPFSPTLATRLPGWWGVRPNRQPYAHDLGDARTLVGVTDSVNQSQADQDFAEWLATCDRCRHLRDRAAVKHRWGLTVDSAEKSAKTTQAVGCTDTTITVTLARRAGRAVRSALAGSGPWRHTRSTGSGRAGVRR